MYTRGYKLAVSVPPLLWVTLWRYEMASKHARAQLRALRRLLGGEDDEPVRRSAAPTMSHAGGPRLRLTIGREHAGAFFVSYHRPNYPTFWALYREFKVF